jgi:hypothetical protein
MTLAAIYWGGENVDGDRVAWAVADSRLTTVVGSELRGHTEFGIKTQTVALPLGGPPHQVLFAFAGAVSLAHHSLLSLESALKHTVIEGGADRVVERIVETLELFRSTARDQDVEYLLALADGGDSRSPRLFHIVGRDLQPRLDISEVGDRGDGVHFAVVGDDAQASDGAISTEVQRFLMSSAPDPARAVEVAIVREVRRRMLSDDDPGIGGVIQLSLIAGQNSEHCAVITDRQATIRAFPVERETELPGKVVDLRGQEFAPETPLEQVVELLCSGEGGEH